MYYIYKSYFDLQCIDQIDFGYPVCFGIAFDSWNSTEPGIYGSHLELSLVNREDGPKGHGQTNFYFHLGIYEINRKGKYCN